MSATFLPLVAYLLGSVPFGILVSRLFGGPDPRTVGSGNIGATNVRRAAGNGAGALTLAADVLKGAVPVYAARALGLPPLWVALTGLGAFAGHLYPLFLAFRGGKGVATACGVMFVISPAATLLAIVVFVIVVSATRFVSLGSMLGASAMPVLLYVLHAQREFTGLGLAVAGLILLKHRANIRRLILHEENRL